MKIIQRHDSKTGRTKLLIQNFPVHGDKKSFQIYNLYGQQEGKGVEQSVLLKTPCIRQGCLTSCYFEGRTISRVDLLSQCSNCGRKSSKIFLDRAYQIFLHQLGSYINKRRPLYVELRLERQQYIFSFNQLKNDFVSSVSDIVGDKIVQQMKFDKITILQRKPFDSRQLQQTFQFKLCQPRWNRSVKVHNFCKYALKSLQNNPNCLLLFLQQDQAPLKVFLINQDGTQFCNSSTFFNDVVINFIGQLNTFIFCVPSPRGTRYFFSCLNTHLDIEEKELVVIEKEEWKEKVGRFGCNVMVNQVKKVVYIVGGHDEAKNELPDHIICFHGFEWKISSGKYILQGKCVSRTRKNNQKRLCIPKVATKNSTCVLINDVNAFNDEKSSNLSLNQYFMLLGGKMQDYSFFKYGFKKGNHSGIRYLSFGENEQMIDGMDEKSNDKVKFQKDSYLVIELPSVKNRNCRPNPHVLVLGGKTSEKHIHNADKADKQMYLCNTAKPQQTITKLHQIPQQILQLLKPNNNNFSTLLKQNSKQYSIQTIYPLSKPIKVSQSHYISFLIIYFQAKMQTLRIVPGRLD